MLSVLGWWGADDFPSERLMAVYFLKVYFAIRIY